MPSALVLGSSGMVGRAVSAHLRDVGVRVTVANRSGAGGAIALDATDPPPLESLLAGADLVVNAIGVLRSDPEYPGTAYRLRAALVNASFPLLLARAAERQGVRLVHISTDAVFRPAQDPADEHTELSPIEPYGFSKALGEAEAEHVINVRCSVVGPAPDRATGLWQWFVAHPQGAEVTGYATRWTGVTSRQLAILCADLIDRGAFERVRAAGPTHHFVPNEPITKYELLTLLGTAVRPDLTVVRGENGREGRELVASSSALDGVFSGPRGWQEALADAVARA